MTLSRHLVAVLGLAAVALATTGTSAHASDGGAPAAIPACVQVSTNSRYVPYGYNHVVILTNGCARHASCTVATDVNPERQSAEVPSRSSLEVMTFMGSASSTFTARVSCHLR